MRIFVDVTGVYFHSHRTGIPRVTQKLSDHLAAIDGVDLRWFVFQGGEFHFVPRGGNEEPGSLARIKAVLRRAIQRIPVAGWILRLTGRAIWPAICSAALLFGRWQGRSARIDALVEGDVVLQIEGAVDLAQYDRLESLGRKMTRIAIISDLFPLRHPQFFDPDVPGNFAREFAKRVRFNDALVCVSGETEKSLRAYLLSEAVEKPIARFYPGSDLDPAAAGAMPQNDGRGKRVSLLSVNVLEPRKNHDFALNICSRLWADGLDFDYTLIGPVGWQSAAFDARMRSHPEFGKRLHYGGVVEDSVLAQLYADHQIFREYVV